MHDGVEIIEYAVFNGCHSLTRIKLLGVKVIEGYAFWGCTTLTDVEFGDKLEYIGDHAFARTSIKHIKLTKLRVIGPYVFSNCEQLAEADLSKDLERIELGAFESCPRLRRIAFPLKDNLLGDYVFDHCAALSQVDLVGGIHKAISSLLLDSWRNKMNDEIDRINRDLPNTPSNERTDAIRRWTGSVVDRIEHYKSEHYALLKKFTTLLELALWKAKLEEFEEALSKEYNTTAAKVRIDTKATRQEKRITSGANIVIKNVLPFLKLE
jgi:hypothetical protein